MPDLTVENLKAALDELAKQQDGGTVLVEGRILYLEINEEDSPWFDPCRGRPES